MGSRTMYIIFKILRMAFELILIPIIMLGNHVANAELHFEKKVMQHQPVDKSKKR